MGSSSKLPYGTTQSWGLGARTLAQVSNQVLFLNCLAVRQFVACLCCSDQAALGVGRSTLAEDNDMSVHD